MFAQYCTYLERTFPTVWRAISGRSSLEMASLDDEGGEELLARAGVRVAGIAIYKHVRLELGQPQLVSEGRLGVLPLKWRPSGGPPLLPDLQGVIRFAADADRTRMTLNANYQPPGGSLGAVIDRALLYRLADATVRDFVLRLAAEVDSILGSSSPVGWTPTEG